MGKRPIDDVFADATAQPEVSRKKSKKGKNEKPKKSAPADAAGTNGHTSAEVANATAIDGTAGEEKLSKA